MVLKNLFDKKNTSLYPSQIYAALLSEYSNKDLTKAFELIRYFNLCEQGHLITNTSFTKHNRKIKLLGAENWGSVMCYLDSLLFSMFAKLENFEPLLLSFESDQDENIKLQRLRAILRVYVSLLRSGKLITYDLTRVLCESLYENGFEEALSRKQEDSCQLFIFLTELLSMPLLTLKIDIAHGGKEAVKDDHRFTKERMLYVSIPSEDDEIKKIDHSNSNSPENGASDMIGRPELNPNAITPVLTVQNQEVLTPTELKERETIINNEVETETLTDSSDLESSQLNNKTDVDKSQSIDQSKDTNGQGIEGKEEKKTFDSEVDNKGVVSKEESDKLGDNKEVVSKEAVSKEEVEVEPERESILLEECLEHYFNNSIQVKRQLERRLSIRRNTVTQLESLKEHDTEKPEHLHVEECQDDELDVNLTEVNELQGTIQEMLSELNGISAEGKLLTDYTNIDGGIVSYGPSVAADTLKNGQSKLNNDEDAVDPLSSSVGHSKVSFDSSANDKTPTRLSRSYSTSKDASYNITSRSRANSSVSIFSDSKNGEVSLPAWMFLQLLPFYTDLEPSSQTEQSFAEKRPILPICLKRYTFGKSSQKNNKRVIIPSFIDLPDFIADDDRDVQGNKKITGKFRLVLESVVCHRGHNIDGGHFVSIVRDEPFDPNTSEDAEDKKRWLLFDDLAISERVKPITFKDAITTEVPYILFYRMDTFVEPKRRASAIQVPVKLGESATDKLADKLTALHLESHNKLNPEKQILEGSSHSDRKKSDTSTVLSEVSLSGSDGSTLEAITPKKSHDIISKMVFYNSTYPYPNSGDYVDIKDKYYWKYKHEGLGYIEETPLPNIFVRNSDTVSNSTISSKHYNKRDSMILSDNDSAKSLFSDDSLQPLSQVASKDIIIDNPIIDNNSNNSSNNNNNNNNSNNSNDQGHKANRLSKMNSGVNSFWLKRRKSSYQKSKSDRANSNDSSAKGPFFTPNESEDTNKSSQDLSTTFSVNKRSAKEGHLSPAGSSVHSPRSSFEVSRLDRDKYVIVNDADKEQDKLKRSKSTLRRKSSSAKGPVSKTKTNDVKARREKYKDEKCTIV